MPIARCPLTLAIRGAPPPHSPEGSGIFRHSKAPLFRECRENIRLTGKELGALTPHYPPLLQRRGLECRENIRLAGNELGRSPPTPPTPPPFFMRAKKNNSPLPLPPPRGYFFFSQRKRVGVVGGVPEIATNSLGESAFTPLNPKNERPTTLYGFFLWCFCKSV